MSKHAKAPWSLGSPRPSGVVDRSTGVLIAGYYIVSVFAGDETADRGPSSIGDIRDTDKTLPNAHLIIAAPDLLDACKLALAYLQSKSFSDGDAYPALVKAISKAEGETK